MSTFRMPNVQMHTVQMSTVTARVWHRQLLAAALVVKGLSWPAAPPPIAAVLIACGLVALSGHHHRTAFAVASGTIWLTIATDSYVSNRFILLGLLTAYAVIMSPRPGARWGLGELLTMVQISAMYFWAAIWKLNAEFLSGAVVMHDWDGSWLMGPTDVPQWAAIVVAAATILGGLALAGLVWVRRLVVPWALGLAIVLHVGMILTVGRASHTTGELIAFALACLSSYPLFMARPITSASASWRTPLQRPGRATTTEPTGSRAMPAGPR